MKAQELITVLKEKLNEELYEFKLDPKTNKLRIEHRELNKGMDLLLGDVLSKYDERKEQAIDEVVYIIRETFEAMRKEQTEGFSGGVKIYPAIRSGSFAKKSQDGHKFLIDQHTAETAIYYALDLGRTYRLIDESMLAPLNLTKQQVKEAARFQVRSLPTNVKKDEVAGNIFYFLNENDGYDASRILNESFLKEMADKVQGEMTVSVPHQDVLIIGDIRNKEGYDILAQMTMHFFTVGAVPVTSLSFIYEDNKLEPIFIMAKNKAKKEQQ
ncbi:DUF1444 family protein [Kurthia sibirica]|uniref:DUF1444 domain-containing protein n=1 Tax=Kurthia sibirica TaxID=202750 RepID=A0A2U3AP07_9BACL|nr:DUF1444 family protein [Kurthia sibirica]PWI26246.1 DUF1444 domain-containing protein [Kurthia sibirica]GEK33860.1 UPF0354 protein [Kurthia sibirica]